MAATGFRKTLHKYRKYIGIVGALIGIVSFGLFLKSVWITKVTVNFPYSGLYITMIGWALTALYGMLDNSLPTLLLGITYFCIFSFVLYIKITNPPTDNGNRK
jgi:uncharacterized protein with PQ loop repeat